MSSLFSLLKSLTKNWLRSKAGIFFSLLFPVMLLLVFTAVFGGQEDVQYTLYIQNRDVTGGEATELSEKFIEGLEATGTFNLREVNREVDLEKGLEKDTGFDAARRGLIIPRGFHAKSMDKIIELRTGVIQDTMMRLGEAYGDMMSEDDRRELSRGMERMQEWQSEIEKESAQVILLTSEGDQAAPVIRGTVRGVVDTFNQEAMGIEESAVKVENRPLVSRSLEAVDYYLPGFIAAFIMTNGIIGVTGTVTEYKRNGVLKRLAATPLTKMKWILANVMQQTLLAFMLTAVMILLGIVFFDVRAFPDLYAAGFIFTGAVAFSAAGMVLGGF